MSVADIVNPFLKNFCFCTNHTFCYQFRFVFGLQFCSQGESWVEWKKSPISFNDQDFFEMEFFYGLF